MRVAFTPASAADLESIANYIAEDNPVRAETFVIDLESACLGLVDSPYRHALLPERSKSGIRRRVHGAYSIFYRVQADHVEILRILNSAMDYEAILFPKN